MTEPFRQIDQSYFVIKEWESLHPNLIAGITTRQGGESHPPYGSMNLGLHVSDHKEAVITNRQKLSEKLGFPIERWVFAEQVHQTEIVIVTSDHSGKGTLNHHDAMQGCDGLITNEQGLLLTALFADCVPLYFFDPTTGWIGIAHAGWRGSVNHMANAMIEKLQELGVSKTDLRVAIGPSIGKTQYEVDENVVSHLSDNLKEKTTKPTKKGHYMLDLKGLNYEIITQAGVLDSNISVTSYCTYKEKGMFFSHRRDKGGTGRMVGFIGYKS
jgi:YfiH family protein